MSAARLSIRATGGQRFMIGALALLILCCGLWYRYGGRPSTDRSGSIARAIAGGRLDDAEHAAELWLKADPESAAAHFQMAAVAWARADLPRASLELNRARDLGYDREQLDRLRGLLLARSNHATEAEPLLRRAFDQAHPADPEIGGALTQIYLGTFRLGEAGLVLERWMHEVPSDARPYMLQAEIDTRTGASHAVLIDRYQAALERDPNFARARLGLAEELRVSHRYADAAPQYALYLKHHPDDPVGHIGAGLNALETGNFAEAVASIDRALEQAPRDSKALAARAAIEQRQGRPLAALPIFDQAIAADPFNPTVRYDRMLVLASLGRKAEADAERRRIEQIKFEQERFDRLSLELVRNPGNTQLQSEAAQWLMSHARQEEGVAWANLVLRTDPSHPAINRLLADYFRKKGQFGLANMHEVHATHAAGVTKALP